MLYLKELNLLDAKKEYEFMQTITTENGFINDALGLSYKDFVLDYLPRKLDSANGKNLPMGYVPCTYYFLWLNDEIIGLYKIRHYLNNSLSNGSGHIGFAINKDHRNKGYGTLGLRLAISKLSKIIQETEIFMSCYSDNLASLKVMLNNGAYIHHTDATKIYTRIKVKK